MENIYIYIIQLRESILENEALSRILLNQMLETQVLINEELSNNPVAQSLETLTENDYHWSENKQLHSKLTKIAATIVYYRRKKKIIHES